MDEEQKDEEAAEPQKRKWLALVLTFGLIIAAGFIVFRGAEQQSITASTAQNAEQTYKRILGETRTGLRLARLDDFLAQYPQSAYVPAARTQRAALKARETMAWAKLADTVYDLDALPADKSLALANYVRQWSQLNRQSQLEALGADIPSAVDTLTFAKPRSRFNQGEDGALAGARQGRIVRPPVTTPQPRRAAQRSDKTVDVRVRTSRRPVYPRKAFRKGINAQITLALDIDEDGRVAHVRVVSASASAYKNKFIKAAKRAARRSRFHPKTVNGQAVASSGYLRNYTFRAEE